MPSTESINSIKYRFYNLHIVGTLNFFRLKLLEFE
jgi:hypothetical protein